MLKNEYDDGEEEDLMEELEDRKGSKRKNVSDDEEKVKKRHVRSKKHQQKAMQQPQPEKPNGHTETTERSKSSSPINIDKNKDISQLNEPSQETNEAQSGMNALSTEFGASSKLDIIMFLSFELRAFDR